MQEAEVLVLTLQYRKRIALEPVLNDRPIDRPKIDLCRHIIVVGMGEIGQTAVIGSAFHAVAEEKDAARFSMLGTTEAIFENATAELRPAKYERALR